jgi:hypothetical protein
MNVQLKDVFKTPSGKFIELTKVSSTGLHHFIEVEDNLTRTPVPEQRNKFGHVIRRVNLQYSEETLSSFKKLESL